MIYINFCVYRDGIHYPGLDCPHDVEEDETGLVYPIGWTTQQEN